MKILWDSYDLAFSMSVFILKASEYEWTVERESCMAIEAKTYYMTVAVLTLRWLLATISINFSEHIFKTTLG